MPGPAVHYIVAEKFRVSLARRGRAALNDTTAINNFPSAFALGAMGPDFLFFNLRDLQPHVAAAVKTVIGVADFIEDFSRELEALIPPPIMDALEAVDDLTSNSVLFTEVQELVGEMQAVINVLLASGQSWLLNLADDQFDLYEIFQHPIQDNQPKDQWWWFDSLHYARTGKFTTGLLQNAGQNEMARAYALGYLTHYSADIVGHPYVNMIAGGPFRTYGQRHKVVENFQDTWAWDRYHSAEFTRSGLHNEFLLSGTDARMPSQLSRFIAEQIEATYRNDFGQLPTPDDIDQAYRLFYMWLKSTTDTGLPPEPWSYSLSAELQQAWEQFESNAGSIIDGYNDAVSAAGGPTSIFGLIAALVGLIIAGLLMGAALIDFIAGSLITIAGAPVREFLAITYQILYSVYLQIRYVTALKALAHPLRADIGRLEVAHLINPQVADIVGGLPSTIQLRTPKIEFSSNNSLNLENHLFCPVGVPDEEVSMTLAPDSYYLNLPSHYINGDVGQAQSIMAMLGTVDVSTAETAAFRTQMRKDQLGSAVDFSLAGWMETQSGATLPDLSLDGDRGIAWPCNELQHPLTNPVGSVDLS